MFLEVDAGILVTWVGNAAARLAYAASPLAPAWGSAFKVLVMWGPCWSTLP